MRRLILIAYVLTFSSLLAAQNKRLWVLRTPGQAVEYDTTTLAEKRKVEIPPEAVASPLRFSVNALGQMLFALPAALPCAFSRSMAGISIGFRTRRAACSAMVWTSPPKRLG